MKALENTYRVGSNPATDIKIMADKKLTMELCCCEMMLLREIADPIIKRNDVSQTYALSMRSSERMTIDWEKVNKAILKRWSKHALHWIKDRAWSGRCFPSV